MVSIAASSAIVAHFSMFLYASFATAVCMSS